MKKGEEIWCTEQILKNILLRIFPNENIFANKIFRIDDTISFKPDYTIPNKKLLIEFQGYSHYTDPKVIFNDVRKREWSTFCGYRFIELPYFVQPTKSVLNYLFGDISTISDFSNGFPHGFIHPACTLPGAFSIFGLQKLLYIFKNFPKEVKEDIIKSVEKRSKLNGVVIQAYLPILHPLYKNLPSLPFMKIE